MFMKPAFNIFGMPGVFFAGFFRIDYVNSKHIK
jgi:hypothetical protein